MTGAGSGIGRSIALSFAKEGARVIVADIMVEAGEETVQLIRGAGGESMFFKTDVSNSSEVEALVSGIIRTYGRLDFACNNAGIEGETCPIAEVSEEDWDRTININLKGVWLCLKYEIAQMLKQGGGAIVNISSTMGLVAHEGVAPYVASKHGVIGLTKAAALEYAKTGVRVNAVCPGIIQTSILNRVMDEYPEILDNLKASTPIGRIGKPEEIANAIIWLCSDASSYVTGHSMVVDGAYTIQ